MGNAIREGERNRRKCKRIGVKITTTMVRKMIDGVGSRKEESKFRGSTDDIFCFLFLALHS